MTLDEAIKHLESWMHDDEYPNLAIAIETILDELKRLSGPLLCAACGAPQEAHVPDPHDFRLWRIWIPDPRYPVWGTSHAMFLRRMHSE